VGVVKGMRGEVRYQLYTAVSVDLEGFDMFTNSGKESQTNFLEENIQNTLISRSLKQLRMRLKIIHNGLGRRRGFQIRIPVTCDSYRWRTVIGSQLFCRKNVLHMRNQHLPLTTPFFARKYINSLV